jgi:hypothetical protein
MSRQRVRWGSRGDCYAFTELGRAPLGAKGPPRFGSLPLGRFRGRRFGRQGILRYPLSAARGFFATCGRGCCFTGLPSRDLDSRGNAFARPPVAPLATRGSDCADPLDSRAPGGGVASGPPSDIAPFPEWRSRRCIEGRRKTIGAALHDTPPPGPPAVVSLCRLVPLLGLRPGPVGGVGWGRHKWEAPFHRGVGYVRAKKLCLAKSREDGPH